KFNLTIPLQQLNGLETLVIIMVANKYAFLQITRRRFLNEWEAFKKVISRRNIRRRITIPLTLSNLKLLRRITRTERSEERFSRNAETDLVCRLLLEKKKKNHEEHARKDKRLHGTDNERVTDYRIGPNA